MYNTYIYEHEMNSINCNNLRKQIWQMMIRRMIIWLRPPVLQEHQSD